MRSHQRLTATAVAVVAVLPAASRAESIDRRIDASPRGVLEIVNPDGEIVVEAWDRNEVRVTGEISDRVDQFDLRADGDRIILEVRVEPNEQGGFGFGFGRNYNWNGSSDLLIRAPATMSLDVRTRAADVDVSDMRGEQRISAVSGDIRTDAYDEGLRIESVSGDIRIEGHDGNALIRVSAVSGDVRLGDVAGEVWADSVSGDVVLIGGTLAEAELKSVSGDIRVMAAIAADARLDAIATSGDVDFDFRGRAEGEYRLETFSGSIDACFGPARDEAVERRSRFAPGAELRFTEGRSSARIEARTHSGHIRVCRE